MLLEVREALHGWEHAHQAFRRIIGQYCEDDQASTEGKLNIFLARGVKSVWAQCDRTQKARIPQQIGNNARQHPEPEETTGSSGCILIAKHFLDVGVAEVEQRMGTAPTVPRSIEAIAANATHEGTHAGRIALARDTRQATLRPATSWPVDGPKRRARSRSSAPALGPYRVSFQTVHCPHRIASSAGGSHPPPSSRGWETSSRRPASLAGSPRGRRP